MSENQERDEKLRGIEMENLKESVKRINELKERVRTDFFELGRILSKIKSSGIYKEQYSSFEAFLRAIELEKVGYHLIRIATSIPEPKAKEVGWKKSNLILPVVSRVNERTKEEIFEMAKVQSSEELKKSLEPIREEIHLPTLSTCLNFGRCSRETKEEVDELLEKIMEKKSLAGSKAEAIRLILVEYEQGL